MKKREGIGMRKIRTLFYCIKQGIRGTWKNRMYSLASAGTITACLLLLGVFYFVMANFNHAVNSAETLKDLEGRKRVTHLKNKIGTLRETVRHLKLDRI